MEVENLIYGIEELKGLVEKRDIENKKIKKYKNPNEKVVKSTLLLLIFICPVMLVFPHKYQGVTAVASLIINKGIDRKNLVILSNKILIGWIIVALIILIYQCFLKSIIFRYKVRKCESNIYYLESKINKLSEEYGIAPEFRQEKILKSFLKDFKNKRANDLRDCINYYMNETCVDNIVNSIKNSR
ncbi:hypothetical protein [Clostridium sp. ZS2-4]|uniref:hypothetical protein n=1 Tax=Clostridium sp. ZS2-4 TaxID=2987703 RepID=UPI00227C2154|nr:hypothetical protein [Clostridium sp. ZS2-4]MCY6356515.1 hypothetical protein [Clostridium sp. ZS2-4]